MNKLLNPDDGHDAGSAPQYLDAKQLSKKLNVSVKAVIHWTQTRQLPFIKMGRLNRYPSVEIEKRLLSGSLLSEVK